MKLPGPSANGDAIAALERRIAALERRPVATDSLAANYLLANPNGTFTAPIFPNAIPSGALSPSFGRASTYANPTLRDFVSVLDFGAYNDGSHIDATTTAIQDAINTGAIAYAPPGTYAFHSLVGVTAGGLVGAGMDATTFITDSPTGSIIELDGVSFFSCSDFLLRPSVQRTAGQFFYLNDSTGSCQGNSFRRLRLASSYIAFYVGACTQIIWDDIYLLDYQVWPGYAGWWVDGTATSLFLDNLRGNTAGGFVRGWLVFDGTGIDTVQGKNWDFTTNSGTSAAGLVIASGEWYRLTNISLEAGTDADAVTISGGRGITLDNVHLLGTRGILWNGGRWIQVNGGEIYDCQHQAIFGANPQGAASGVGQHFAAQNLFIANSSQAGHNLYPSIEFGSAYHWRLINNSIGYGDAEQATAIGVQIDSPCDFYVVADNDIAGATAVLDGGGGTNKFINNNV